MRKRTCLRFLPGAKSCWFMNLFQWRKYFTHHSKSSRALCYESAMGSGVNSREVAFLRVVERGGGELGWHAVESRLSLQDLPSRPGAVELGRRLAVLGMVSATDGAYAITERGRAFLRDAERLGWPLGPAEAAELARALSGPITARVAAVAPLGDDPAHFERALRQLLATGDRAVLAGVAWALLLLDEERRAAIAFALAADERADARAALFRAWGGPGEGVDEQARFKPPAPGSVWEGDARFVELLRLGLSDAAFEVRDAAARLVYVTASGARVVDALLADLAAARPSPWSAAALGAAHDAASLAVLRRLLAGDDERMAAAAVRALGARSDGRAELLAAFSDARRAVVWMAEMALGYLATGLSTEELARIERANTPQLSMALAFYHARQRSDA
jgi:hypothetical protein